MSQEEIPTPRDCGIEIKSPQTGLFERGYFSMNFAGDDQPIAYRLEGNTVCFRLFVPVGQINLQLTNTLFVGSRFVVLADIVWRNYAAHKFGPLQRVLVYPMCSFVDNYPCVPLGNNKLEVYIRISFYQETALRSWPIGEGGEMYICQEEFGLGMPQERSLKVLKNPISQIASYKIELVGIPPFAYKLYLWQKNLRKRFTKTPAHIQSNHDS